MIPNETRSKIVKYILRIRNENKQNYALLYYDALKKGLVLNAVSRGKLGAMGAQAVRLAIRDILEGVQS